MNNKMPVIFVGHGSPMNAIEDNSFTEKWEEIGRILPKPSAILCVSAHWFSNGSFVSDEANPKQIYDMYGFPKELYELKYPVKGSPILAEKVKDMLEIEIDNDWGIDHGTWSVLCKMYPEADIPTFQLSVNRNEDAKYYYDLGRQLSSLREEGVLIIGSGNVVHNLRLIEWDMPFGGFDWAHEFDDIVKNHIREGNHNALIDYKNLPSSSLAVPTIDHYAPLLYVLGAAGESSQVSVFNDSCVMGSLSMTSYIFE